MNYDVVTYTIAVPSLQRLNIGEDYCGGGSHEGGYVINTPSLKYLNMDCIISGDFCLMENAPELVEAKIVDVPHVKNENILASLTSAKCLLRFTLYGKKKIKYPIFYQLVSLELHVNELNVGNLWLMLDNSPKLQKLKLISVSNCNNDYFPVEWEWNQTKRVPECLLFHLETFMWTEYEWEREDEKQVGHIHPPERWTVEESNFSCWKSWKRASTSCHLVLE
ncbi:hypothetical protein F2Q69_00054657 [Brassica cretica]|uniref:FBD domain-containing protein n=1 Tax=Brassica cretica TaxID=69181 RepID=A0A8S9N990_BRACR|nr:hypothetical protein F2Q69_00054657 [Brassica cretica]